MGRNDGVAQERNKHSGIHVHILYPTHCWFSSRPTGSSRVKVARLGGDCGKIVSDFSNDPLGHQPFREPVDAVSGGAGSDPANGRTYSRGFCSVVFSSMGQSRSARSRHRLIRTKRNVEPYTICYIYSLTKVKQDVSPYRY